MDRFLISLMNALPAAAGAPEWVHLMPSGTFSGADGRGPYEAGDLQAVIDASMKSGRKLAIDINHSTDIRGVKGEEAPAVGWIIVMEARADGVWGKVEWTNRGKAAVANRAYGYLSPVLIATAAKPHRVVSIARAALTNDPNLTLTSLHTTAAGEPGEDDMLKALREALGLPETADEAAVLAAIEGTAEEVATHAAHIGQIAEAAGLAKDAKPEAIVAALQARETDKGAGNDADLKATIKALQGRVTDLTNASAKTAAETAIDKAIEAGKLVPALRDHFIARHMKDADEVDAEIKLLPSLHAGGLGKRRLIQDGQSALTEAEQQICELMGIDPVEFAKTAKSLQKEAF